MPGRFMAVLAVSCMLAVWAGCTPEKKYEVLSFFFDGVPNPSDTAATGSETSGNTGGTKLAMMAFVHKPFAEGKCLECHKQPGLLVNTADLQDMCIKCHKDVLKKHPITHLPVVMNECMWCHSPHTAPDKHLLRAKAPALCMQCHDGSLLTARTPAHMDPASDCLTCHLGHGGAKPSYLKPDLAPTTAPATQAVVMDQEDKP